MTITQKQYNDMVKAIIAAEKDSLSGNRAQVYFDTESGDVWIAHLSQGERYTDDGNYVRLYAVDAWEDKLKDIYGDDNDDVDWDAEDYRFTPAYEEFENWYFDDSVDGFAVYDILDAALAKHDIEVGDETLYETDDMIIKQLSSGAIVAGYKGEELYKVHDVEAAEIAEGDWVLTYKRGTQLFTRYTQGFSSDGLWINGKYHHNRRDGRFVSDDEETLYEALLEMVDDDGEFVRGYLMGYTSEIG